MMAEKIELGDLSVTSKVAGESTQPWSGKPCFGYKISVSTRWGHYDTKGFGSQVDYENGIDSREEEMAWMILHDLLSAYDDPEEFFSMSLGEPDDIDLQRVRGILETIDFANKIGAELDKNREVIEESYDRF